MTLELLTALGCVLLQPPGPGSGGPPAPTPPKTVTETVTRIVPRMQSKDESEARELEKAIASHPDVRVARAKLDEAEAALAQARLRVAIEVTTNQAKLDQARADVETKTVTLQRLEKLRNTNVISQDECSQAAADLRAAKAALDSQERLAKATDSSFVRGVRIQRVEDHPSPGGATRVFDVADLALPVRNAEPLRKLLEQKVKFTVKEGGEPVIAVLERSLKEWGFDAAKQIVRYPFTLGPKFLKNPSMMQPVEGENTVGVWLLLMLDDFNGVQTEGKHQIYVREYGLLFTLVKAAPDGAPTLAEFLRMPAAK